jgi:DNA-binding transcriptional ArsR family regulator
MAMSATTTEAIDLGASRFFEVLSSPIRLAVLGLLVDDERCVTELVSALQIAQPRLSNHLACLRTCGLVTIRREGTFVYYSLADERVADVLRLGEALAAPSGAAFAGCAVLQNEHRGGKSSGRHAL